MSGPSHICQPPTLLAAQIGPLMAVKDLGKQAAPWRTCATCAVLRELKPVQAKQLRDLLANPLVRYSELSVELANDPDWMVDIDRQALARHARGLCEARERLRGSR